MFFHCFDNLHPPFLQNDGIAVGFFFVLSGFVVYHAYGANLKQSMTFAYGSMRGALGNECPYRDHLSRAIGWSRLAGEALGDPFDCGRGAVARDPGVTDLRQNQHSYGAAAGTKPLQVAARHRRVDGVVCGALREEDWDRWRRWSDRVVGEQRAPGILIKQSTDADAEKAFLQRSAGSASAGNVDRRFEADVREAVDGRKSLRLDDARDRRSEHARPRP